MIDTVTTVVRNKLRSNLRSLSESPGSPGSSEPWESWSHGREEAGIESVLANMIGAVEVRDPTTLDS